MVNKSFTLPCSVLDKLTSQIRNFRIFDKLFNAILSQKKNIIETSGLGRSKLSLDNPGVSLKVDFWSESFKRSRKCSSNLFACNLIAGCSNENKENCLLKVFEQRNKKKPGLKFTPELALIGLRTTGPYAHMKLLRVQCAKHFLPVYISTFFF